ncbi:MAG: hypothetical protein HY039_11795 [Nitrospirae bacterium]|nr:hypothetical protein [Nitrospirota bacterium]
MTRREEETRADLLAELRKAGTRIGSSVDDVSRWLLRFVQREPSSLSAGDLSNLSYEIVHFLGHGVPDDSSRPVESGLASPLVRKGGTYIVRKGEYDLSGPWPTGWKFFPSPADIERFQTFAAGAVMSAVRGNGLVLDLPPVELRLSPPSWKVRPHTEDAGALWTYQIAHLLGKTAPRIHLCPECKTLFLADRVDQKFCSPRCQQKDATLRYRERHGLISGRPRGRPRKTETQPPKTAKPKGGKHGKSKR